MLVRTVLMAVVVMGAATLAGCSPLMRGATDTLRIAMASPPQLEVSRAQVMQRPSYQLRIDSPFGSAIMILARVEGRTQYWVTSSRQVLLVENGLVRRSTGFPENLEGTRFAGGQAQDPFAAGLHRIDAPLTAIRELDWMPGYRYGVRVSSTFERIGYEAREILGEQHRLVRIDERYRAEGVEFSGVNRYWVSPEDGFVFVTEQTLAPGLPVRLTQLRPYREPGR